MVSISLGRRFMASALSSKNRLCHRAMPSFHEENERPPLEAKVITAIGNCGLYTDPWGVRAEDTVVASDQEPLVLTDYPR